MQPGLVVGGDFGLHREHRDYPRVPPRRIAEDGLLERIERPLEQVVDVRAVREVLRELVLRQQKRQLEEAGLRDGRQVLRGLDDRCGPAGRRFDITMTLRLGVRDAAEGA